MAADDGIKEPQVFLLVQWEDRYMSVIQPKDVVHPRKDQLEYQEGDLIQAMYKTRNKKKMYHAVISEIHQDRKFLMKQAKLPPKYSYEASKDKAREQSLEHQEVSPDLDQELFSPDLVIVEEDNGLDAEEVIVEEDNGLDAEEDHSPNTAAKRKLYDERATMDQDVAKKSKSNCLGMSTTGMMTPPGTTAAEIVTPPGKTAAGMVTPPGKTAAGMVTLPGKTAAKMLTPPGKTAAGMVTPPGKTAAGMVYQPGKATAGMVTLPGKTAAEMVTPLGKTAAGMVTLPGKATAGMVTPPGKTAAEMVTPLGKMAAGMVTPPGKAVPSGTSSTKKTLEERVKDLEREVRELKKKAKRSQQQSDSSSDSSSGSRSSENKDLEEILKVVKHLNPKSEKEINDCIQRVCFTIFTKEELITSSRTGKKTVRSPTHQARPPLDKEKIDLFEKAVYIKCGEDLNADTFKRKFDNIIKMTRREAKR